MKELRSSLRLARWYSTKNYRQQGLFTFNGDENENGNFVAPVLPVLTTLANDIRSTESIDFSDTVIVGTQHLLPTTASLFDVLIDIFGVNPKNMFFKGKCYSTVPAVQQYMINRGINITRSKNPRAPGHYQETVREEIEDMWALVEKKLTLSPEIQKIIVLDDGGMCLESVPKNLQYNYALAGIEQTRFGLYSKTVQALVFPLIDVARSAAKKNLESTLIADATLRRLETLLKELDISPRTVFGVAGNGSIGSAITRFLLAQNFQVAVYDESENAFYGIQNTNFCRMDKLENLIAGCDIIFGCGGRDVTQNLDVTQFVNGKAVFISCSSQDIEFLSLLKQMGLHHYSERTSNKLSFTSHLCESNREIIIVEKGFPINFDRTAECDPPHDMSLTRTLLLSAIAQGAQLARSPIKDGRTPNKSLHYKLDPEMQKKCVELWKKSELKKRFSPEDFRCFEDINWISRNSSGALGSKTAEEKYLHPSSYKLTHGLN